VKKKRREIPQPVILGRHSAGGSWVRSLSGGQLPPTDAIYGRYGICPVFGKGEILHYQWEDLELIISRLQLRQDIVLMHSLEEDCLQLSFLLDGEKVITAEDEKQLVQEKGESYLASLKGFRGSVRLGCAKPFTEIKIRTGLSLLPDQRIMDYNFCRQLGEQHQIRPIPQELLAILINLERRDLSPPAHGIYLRAKALELLALQMESYRFAAADATEGYGRISLRKLYRVRKIIADNLHMNFSMAELSAASGISATLLNDEFYRAFGLSVNEFSGKAKMELARQLLAHSDQLIYEIAEAVGYKNATHFSAAFKRYSGKTPKQYRNTI
jgi:AraC-like DNA-binding protein